TIMENIFSPARFGSLLNKHIRAHLRTYLMSLIVFGAAILAIFIFLVSNSNILSLSLGSQFAVCSISLLLGMFIFTGNIFSDYNHSRSAFTATMLPASIFEKYLLYWLVSLIGFTIFALGVYHLSQGIILEYIKTQGAETTRFFVWNEVKNSLPFKWILIIYLSVHSIAFLGAISFRKKTVIITALVSFAIIAAYVYLNYRLSLAVLNGNSVPFPFVPAGIQTVDGWAQIERSNSELWATITLSVIIILFWICVFFKLKERQV